MEWQSPFLLVQNSVLELIIHDERITDDRFVIIVDIDEAGNQETAIKSILEKEDAKNIQVKEIEK